MDFKDKIITYRRFAREADYPFLRDLWVNSKMKEAPSINMLPLDGRVAERDGLIVGAVFTWFTSNSLICFIGFPILDVKLKTDRKEVLKELFHQSEVIAENNGYKQALHYSHVPVMQDFLEDNGYVVAETNVKALLKNL